MTEPTTTVGPAGGVSIHVGDVHDVDHGISRLADWRRDGGFYDRYPGGIQAMGNDACAALDEIERLKDILLDARMQIEYLHGKFRETGTGNTIITKINAALRNV